MNAFNNSAKPRNGNRTQKSGIAKIQRSIATLKAEISPAVKFYKPSINPKPVTAALDSLWLSRKIEVIKGAQSSLNNRDILSALGQTKIDFYVDSMSVWNIGGNSISFSSGTGAIVRDVSIVKSDWGTPDCPASIGFNVPKALAKVFSGVTSSSTTENLCTSDVLASQAIAGNNFVYHIWVVYRPSA